VEWSVVGVGGGGREGSIRCPFYFPLAVCVHCPCSWIVEFESEDGVEKGTCGVRLIEWLGVI
jgi:hypothetical protein